MFHQTENFMITVFNEIKEITEGPVTEVLIIKNHWNYPERVVLIHGGKEKIYLASDLITAIKNATNSNRF